MNNSLHQHQQHQTSRGSTRQRRASTGGGVNGSTNRFENPQPRASRRRSMGAKPSPATVSSSSTEKEQRHQRDWGKPNDTPDIPHVNAFFAKPPPFSARSNFRNVKTRKTARIRRKQWMGLVASLVALASWYMTPLSDKIIPLVLYFIPVSADIELGRVALRALRHEQPNLYRSSNAIYHPHWTPMIQSIAQQLVQAASTHSGPSSLPHKSVFPSSSISQYNWDFGIVQERNIVNAFALPGGTIRITVGLLDTLQPTPGELAGLLGHEMAHVLHRHGQAQILQQSLVQYILDALTYSDEDPHEESFGEALGELLLRRADWFGRQRFSRSNEYQADDTSWNLLCVTGIYNPKGLTAMLDKLWRHNGQHPGLDTISSWEQTHPGTLDRIHALQHKWDALTPDEQERLERTVQ